MTSHLVDWPRHNVDRPLLTLDLHVTFDLCVSAGSSWAESARPVVGMVRGTSPTNKSGGQSVHRSRSSSRDGRQTPHRQVDKCSDSGHTNTRQHSPSIFFLFFFVFFFIPLPPPLSLSPSLSFFFLAPRPRNTPILNS